MDDTRKNQIILISVIIALLFVVIGFIFFITLNKKTVDNSIKFKQIYSSDYDLRILNDNYYFGLYDGKINVVIDNEGKEIHRTKNEISFTDYFNLKDGNSLIYDAEEDVITAYLFNGENIELYDVISDINYGKPLLNSNYELLSFVEIKDNGFDLYDVSKKEVRSIEDYSFVADRVTEKDYYFTNNDDFIVVKKNDLFGVLDLYGNEVISCNYKNIKGIGNNLFIAQDKKGNYGVITTSETKLPFKYKVVYYSDGYYLIVDKNNKMALFDYEFNNLTGFKMEYDSLIDYNLRTDNSIKLIKNNDNILIINNYLEDVNKTEYSKHSLYVYKDGNISTIEEHGVLVDNDIYVYDKDYNLTIYDSSLNELGKFKVNASRIHSIKQINDHIIEVLYDYEDGVNTLKYYDYSGKELELTYGKTIIKNKDYFGCLSDKNNVLTIISNGKVVNELKEDNIRVNNNVIVTKNSLYVIETS